MRPYLLTICLLAGCGLDPAALQPMAIAYFKADSTGKVGQAIAVTAKLALNTPCYGDVQLQAQVDLTLRRVTLVAVARDKTAPGMGCVQAVALTPATTSFVVNAPGSYQVVATLEPSSDLAGMPVGQHDDFSHLTPAIDPTATGATMPVLATQTIQISP